MESPKQETVLEEEIALVEGQKLDQQLQELKLKEKAEFLTFRKQWSKNLLLLVVGLSIFYSVFLLLIGYGLLKFEDEWLVRIIVTGGFAQIIALAKIVVDFLFKEPPIL